MFCRQAGGHQLRYMIPCTSLTYACQGARRGELTVKTPRFIRGLSFQVLPRLAVSFTAFLHVSSESGLPKQQTTSETHATAKGPIPESVCVWNWQQSGDRSKSAQTPENKQREPCQGEYVKSHVSKFAQICSDLSKTTSICGSPKPPIFVVF